MKERHEERHVAGKPHSKVNQKRKSSGPPGSSAMSSTRTDPTSVPVKREPSTSLSNGVPFGNGTSKEAPNETAARSQMSLAPTVPVAHQSISNSSLPSPAWSDSVTRPDSSSTQNTGTLGINTQGLEEGTSSNSMDRVLPYLGPDDLTDMYNYDLGNQFAPYAGVDGFNLEYEFQDLSPHLPDSMSMEDALPLGPPPVHPMAVSNLIQSTSSNQSTSLSETKRKQIVSLIEKEFDERENVPDTPFMKDNLLKGDQTSGTHVLSLGMLQLYLYQYWSQFDPQVPILHKPTFIPDETPNLLLIAMMVLGASSLDRSSLSHQVTNACADLANFLAWHLRWALFRDRGFSPPAELWVFQALLLLETYEKMYSTSRNHHERAHLHHGTTLTLLKRGPFLAGKSTNNPAKSTKTDQGYSDLSLWWQNWIIKEGTRRVVLFAFVMDTTHQTFFGHEMVLNIHEMRLPLPCDECYWTAPSANEIRRLQSLPGANPLKPPPFLDSLQKTLNGKKVQTNIFGRTVLMAGLLNVGWHMSNRDKLVSNLGLSVRSQGGGEKWKVSLKRAFNFWKRDFDESLAHLPEYNSATSSSPSSAVVPNPSADAMSLSPPVDKGNVFESRTVMHHLAFMWLYTDIVDIQIFAQATCLLGRNVTPANYDKAKCQVKEWAQSPGAREAVFHALKFLSDVLLAGSAESSLPTTNPSSGRQTPHHYSGTAAAAASATATLSSAYPKNSYSAREDPLLNRPWVLYHACLIVWAYGYASEGPVPASHNVTLLSKVNDMMLFLQRVGSVRSPEELKDVTRRNHCVGLVMTLRDLFRDTRWELLREASEMLGNCIRLLTSRAGDDG